MRVTRRLIGRRLKMDIAPAALTAAQKNEALVFVFVGKIVDEFVRFGIPYRRAGRNGDDDIFSVFAVFVPARTVAAVFRFKDDLIAELCKRAHIAPDAKHDISSLAAVAAVRPSSRNIFFSAKRDAAVSAFSRADFDHRFICKLCHTVLLFISGQLHWKTIVSKK